MLSKNKLEKALLILLEKILTAKSILLKIN